MSDTSASLLDRLRLAPEGDDWSRLVDLYSPLIRGWLARQGLPRQEADECERGNGDQRNETEHERGCTRIARGHPIREGRPRACFARGRQRLGIGERHGRHRAKQSAAAREADGRSPRAAEADEGRGGLHGPGLNLESA